MTEGIINTLMLLASGIIFFLLGWFMNNRIGNARIKNAEQEAEKIIETAKREAENHKKSALLEAKDEWYKSKAKFDKETQTRKQELKKLEREYSDRSAKLNQKVGLLDKKEKNIINKERELAKKEKNIRFKDERLTTLVKEQNQQLERIAGMTQEEAKKLLMKNLEEEAKHEAARTIKEIRDKAKETAMKEAKEIITLAIQRCSTDHVVESTVSVVNLPNDEMKGRIIGREGRNIRAFETATGVDVIIDDTPEAVILSAFDPIRREIARITLEKLIIDGRIHPGRIEEIAAKTQKEMAEIIREAGEAVCYELNIHNIKPTLINLLGRLKYRTSYGQNVLQHSKEVSYLTGLMASELGFDVMLARRAGLLHDIGKAVDQESEGTHTQIGYELAKKAGEDPIILNAILAHHEDVEPTSVIAVLVQAADAISGGRPGARRETLESYIKRLERLEEVASSFVGVGKAYAVQAGREIRVMIEPEELDDVRASNVSYEIARKIENELEYPGQIKVTVIREIRAIEFAK